MAKAIIIVKTRSEHRTKNLNVADLTLEISCVWEHVFETNLCICRVTSEDYIYLRRSLCVS